MFALISAFVATSYIVSVLFIAFLTVCTFDKPITRELFAGTLRKYLFIVELLTSTVSEFAIHLIALKFLFTKLVSVFGGFNYTLAWLMYYVDIINMAALLVLFYEMLSEKAVSDAAIKSINPQSEPLKSVICLEDVKKILNPIWTPANIKMHPNITYATNEEIREALNTTNQDFDQPRKMVLDVFTSTNKPKSGLQPVLVHIHGGAWRMGSKDVFYPHEKILAQENNWVIVNIGYRLAPKNAYPTHLMDVKRAIRWIKQNIASFGGDPNFVVLSGDSAGAQLASIASMTANDPEFQPGFESVDTSVRGVINFSGALDLVNEAHSALFFSKKVANLDHVDTEFLSQHSPLARVQKAKEENKLVPFLIIAGERDSLTESRQSKAVKAAYDAGKKKKEIKSLTRSCSYVISSYWC
ncbi:unnamed protein product [Mucor hiemalis]